jgi:urea transport system permease protein
VRALAVLEALNEKRLLVAPGGGYIELASGGHVDALAGTPATLPAGAVRPAVSNAVRRALRVALARQRLRSPDVVQRLAAAKIVEESEADPDLALIVRSALGPEKDPKVKQVLEAVLARTEIVSPVAAKRLAAVQVLARSTNSELRPLFEGMLAKEPSGAPREPDARVREAARSALGDIERQDFVVRLARDLFYGLSLGRVLLLAALGLAITFGLMGVINMAHGELIMIGAYSTFVAQNLFMKYAPSLIDWYLVAALPLAFGASMAVGIALERLVIRHLYGRPLETLLATWGISLGLMQAVRSVFGAQNVTVANPSWLAGGWELASNVVLPYARLVSILFAAVVVWLVWLLLNRTSLGLQVRAITQNRAMARAVGIRTARVDMLTFGIGSGVAGLGGVALSQLGNVGPELGEGYIVDSFMVVVVGGVGKLIGTVAASLGLGTVTKVLEPMAGAVLGKILVLGFVILFIQVRPQGIFALKGRAAEG